MKAKDIIIGEQLSGQVFCLKHLSPDSYPYEDMEVHKGVLSDCTGEVNCFISNERYDKSMADLVGGAVLVNGFVLNGKDMVPLLKIKSLASAPQEAYTPSDIFDGLDQLHVEKYEAVIRSSIEKIADGDYKAFANAALTDDVLRMLAVKPASLAYHGVYRGGALACAASVTKMVTQGGWQYQKFNCGLYKPVFDWSLAITASLLCTYGVLDYYTDHPWRKTNAGVQRGYMSILQSSLQEVRMVSPLPSNKFDRLLNVLGCSVPMKTGVKATSPEGMLLRHILMLFEELDMFDASVAHHEPKEGETYYYDPKLRRTVPLGTAEEEAEEGGAA